MCLTSTSLIFWAAGSLLIRQQEGSQASHMRICVWWPDWVKSFSADFKLVDMWAGVWKSKSLPIVVSSWWERGTDLLGKMARLAFYASSCYWTTWQIIPYRVRNLEKQWGHCKVLITQPDPRKTFSHICIVSRFMTCIFCRYFIILLYFWYT